MAKSQTRGEGQHPECATRSHPLGGSRGDLLEIKSPRQRHCHKLTHISPAFNDRLAQGAEASRRRLIAFGTMLFD
ncbi:hypothetical protein KIN20_037937 [Parelaphostrongylus tenuis]|uniref:Uncharacterized protein n=1 Tax=Parelaphostrongylus tenuis TaxID=148309 RepID=A0AAD5REY5_PARTN|nr:hypothetical protein KIN20_037937 [Parelaphostrongylus tenuis]